MGWYKVLALFEHPKPPEVNPKDEQQLAPEVPLKEEPQVAKPKVVRKRTPKPKP